MKLFQFHLGCFPKNRLLIFCLFSLPVEAHVLPNVNNSLLTTVLMLC